MTDFTKDLPRFFKTKSGDKAEVLAHRGDMLIGCVYLDGLPKRAHWHADGTAYWSVYNLVEPWIEPVPPEAWINAYSGRFGALHETKIDADDGAGCGRTSCHKIRLINGKVVDVTEEEG